jgi:hypothetical protein
MEEILISGYFETEVVPAGPPVEGDLPVFSDRPAYGGCRKKDQGTKIEAVPEAPRLIIIQRMFPEGISEDIGIVRINHPRTRRLRGLDQTVRGAGINTDLSRIGGKEDIPCGNAGQDGVPCLAAGRAVGGEQFTAGRTDSPLSGMKDNGLPDQRIPEEALQHTFPPTGVAPGKHRGDHSHSLSDHQQGRGAP